MWNFGTCHQNSSAISFLSSDVKVHKKIINIIKIICRKREFSCKNCFIQVTWLLNPNHLTFESKSRDFWRMCMPNHHDWLKFQGCFLGLCDRFFDIQCNGQGPQMRAECSRLEIPHSDVNCLLSEMLKQFWRQKPGSEFMGHIRDRRLLPFIVQWCPNFLHKKCGDDVTQKEEIKDWKWKPS